MKIARLVASSGPPFWAAVDPVAGSARRLVTAELPGAGEPAPALAHEVLDLAELRLLAPLAPGARVLGVGANYRVHLERFGANPPAEPVAYIKTDSAIIDPETEIRYPEITDQLDYEVELVAIVGGPLPASGPASACLLGYTVGNDTSARDAGTRYGGLDLYSMKALDATTPIGPWITTLDEFGGAGQPSTAIELRVNGEVRQHDDTKNMIFSIDTILRYLDLRTRLRRGDVVFTGTTSGVGLEDGRFLTPGDLVEAEVGQVGVLRNTVGPRPARAAVPPAASASGPAGGR